MRFGNLRMSDIFLDDLEKTPDLRRSFFRSFFPMVMIPNASRQESLVTVKSDLFEDLKQGEVIPEYRAIIEKKFSVDGISYEFEVKKL